MVQGHERREFPRVPLETEVRMEFADLDELASEYSDNLSLGGMFIKSARPLPVGTAFRFELRAGDDQSTIAGEAVVEWIRSQDASETERAGMGVRFTGLDDDSRSLIFDLVDQYIQQTGGEPFHLDES